MGNTCTGLASKRDIRLLLLGLDSSGKTTILQNLNKEETDEIQIPTMGFASRTFTKGRYNVLLMDVGGGPDIRPIWPKYFAETHGVIYVVDLSDTDRLEESKVELRKVLMDERMTCKPLLILFNKADKCEGAVNMMDVMKRLDINNILMESGDLMEGLVQPKIRLWLCSALKSKTRNRQDKKLHKSFNWLLDSISEHWAVLSPRVDAQHGVELREKDRAKEERIRKRREKREEEERLEKEAIAAVEAAQKASNLPETHSGVIAVQSKSDQSSNSTISIVAEIEKGNESLIPVNRSLSSPISEQPKPTILLEGGTPPHDTTFTKSSHLNGVLPPIKSTVNEIQVAGSINKTVTWSNEILTSRNEGDTPSEYTISPASLRRNPLPPIQLCVTPPTESTEQDNNSVSLIKTDEDKKQTSDIVTSVLRDDRGSPLSKEDIKREIAPLEDEPKPEIPNKPKRSRKIRLKFSKNRNKTFPINEPEGVASTSTAITTHPTIVTDTTQLASWRAVHKQDSTVENIDTGIEESSRTIINTTQQ